MANKFLKPLDPFGAARSLRSGIDQLIEHTLIQPAARLANWEPDRPVLPLDMYEEGNNLIVMAALPGLKPEEVDIQVQGDALTITVESDHEHESQDTGRNFQLREHLYSRLERSVMLPVVVDADKAQASFGNGIVTVTLPKTGTTEAGPAAIKTEKLGEMAEAQLIEAQTVVGQTTEAQPIETQTAETRAVETQATEAQPAEAQAAEAKPVEAQAIEAPTADAPIVAAPAAEAPAVEGQTVKGHKARKARKTQKTQAQVVEAEKLA